MGFVSGDGEGRDGMEGRVVWSYEVSYLVIRWGGGWDGGIWKRGEQGVRSERKEVT